MMQVLRAGSSSDVTVGLSAPVLATTFTVVTVLHTPPLPWQTLLAGFGFVAEQCWTLPMKNVLNSSCSAPLHGAGVAAGAAGAAGGTAPAVVLGVDGPEGARPMVDGPEGARPMVDG